MGENAVSRVRVEILGKKYTLRGDVDTDYMVSLARYVDEKLRELKEIAPDADNTKLALLVALNLADELHRAKSGAPEIPEDAAMLKEKTERLIQMLEEGIVGTNFQPK
ncbi:MAG: cell division protein ZapA [Candidatus Hydrogenedentota bacterium]|nr:MAG: cell division protein ZapA [Candidatus Hydrogenedentota bacterium]